MNYFKYDLDSLSETAKEAVRVKFNPSGDPTVQRIKLLAAALITEYEKIRDHAPREISVAITNAQTASMWAVLGVTKGL